MFTCHMFEHIHLRTFRCASCLDGSGRPILPSSACSARAVLRWQRGSAVSSLQPRRAGPAARSCSSTGPGPAASWHAPPLWATCRESTSRSRGRSGYRVPGCPSLLWTCGEWTSPRQSDFGGHRTAAQSRAGCSTAAGGLGHRVRLPWRARCLL
jgi:hypothetical protein